MWLSNKRANLCKLFERGIFMKQAASVGPKKKKKGFFYDLKKHWIMWLMLVPVLIFFLIFNYLPMAGVYLAFTDFSFKGGLFGSPWVGMQNFKTLWDQGKIAYLTKNTVLYNVAFIFLGNFCQIAAAIVLSRMTNKYLKKSYQTIMFLPYFVSYVIVQAFSYALFNSGSGMVTMIVRNLTGNTGFAPYSTPSIWKYIIVLVYLWKQIGYGTVVYLAAITSIGDDYYEAAQIDGASVMQQIRYITIPLLVPTFIILLLLALGQIMRGQFELFYQLVGNQGQLFEATDILDTFVFRMLRVSFDVGIGSAAGLYQSLVGFCLIMFINWAIKRNHEEYALF